MKNLLMFSLLLNLIMNAQTQSNWQYPETKKIDHNDEYFGTIVNDPYHWLENDRALETEAWVKAQNITTYNYLDKIPYRDELKAKIEKLWNYEKVSIPFTEGQYTYYYKNNGLQNQSVLYRKLENNAEEVFLDPNTFSKDGTASLDGVFFSKDGSMVAYTISKAGSDWRNAIIMDAQSKKVLGETMVDLKFTGIAWKGNEGFYYSSYDKPTGSELSSKTDQHKLYYHKLGTSQKDDTVIFGLEQKRRYVGGYLSEDEKYLFISAANATTGNELYFLDLQNKNATITPIILGFEQNAHVLHTIDEKFYIATNLNAPNKKVVTTMASKPTAENWKDLIPETENVLNPTVGGNYIFANYLKDALSFIKQYQFDGKLVRNITLPGIGTVNGFNGKTSDKILYFSFTNYTTPSTSYSFEPQEGVFKIYKKPSINFNSDNFETKQVFFTSKDGTKIPMIITHKKGLQLNGKNPTLLYGYGGFEISLTPSFDISNAIWMENGGVYAVANLRGGGEYGKKWHDAGIKMKKQNVFNDFIAAAEYLKSQKYTATQYLAIKGRSNGGLLIGAVMTQKPDLAKVALPGVGVMDMLRYHTFTAGAGWDYDYGKSTDSKEMFNYLYQYSPVHNVKKGVQYPATLVTTGDHDDRVVPAHSFKFASQLQEKQTGNNPVLIRIDVNAGHGAGKSVAALIQENADILSFTLFNMGFKTLNSK